MTRADQKFSRRLFVSETFYAKAILGRGILQPFVSSSYRYIYIYMYLDTRCWSSRLWDSSFANKFDCRHSQFACHVADKKKCRCRNDVSRCVLNFLRGKKFLFFFYLDDEAVFCACLSTFGNVKGPKKSDIRAYVVKFPLAENFRNYFLSDLFFSLFFFLTTGQNFGLHYVRFREWKCTIAELSAQRCETGSMANYF